MLTAKLNNQEYRVTNIVGGYAQLTKFMSQDTGYQVERPLCLLDMFSEGRKVVLVEHTNTVSDKYIYTDNVKQLL